jgi:adenylosuccinate synthase
VTHSKTGLDNVLELIKGSDINHLDVYYVTRPYLTRHGEGPFPTECKLGFEVKDETNIPNKWQGTLRFGTIDEGLNIRIQEEQEKIPQNISSSLNIALTCCDQVPEQILRTIENCLIAKPIKSYSPCGPTDKV